MIGEVYPIGRSPFLQDDDMLVFTFVSEGRRAINKLVAFTPIIRNGLKCYNWAFGDYVVNNHDIILNDTHLANNGDTKKVFYTVISTLFLFFERYPHAVVYIKGSDDRRTRLYVSLIARHWEEIKNLYEIKLWSNETVCQFNSDKDCDYILVSLLRDRTFD